MSSQQIIPVDVRTRSIERARSKRTANRLRVAIIDDSGLRATVLEEGLRDAGYDDIQLVAPRGGFAPRR